MSSAEPDHNGRYKNHPHIGDRELFKSSRDPPVPFNALEEDLHVSSELVYMQVDITLLRAVYPRRYNHLTPLVL